MIQPIFLTAAVFFFLVLTIFTWNPSESTGDRAIAVGLGLIALFSCFILATTALTITVAMYGGLDRIFPSKPVGIMISLISVTLLGISIFLLTILRWEPWENIPNLIVLIAKSRGNLWIPILYFAPLATIVLSRDLEAIPSWAIRIPLALQFGICVLVSGGLVIGRIRDQAQAENAYLEKIQQVDDENRRSHLDLLDAWTAEQSIYPLLELTNRFHDADIRQFALDRIHSKQGWEEELLAILQDPARYRATYYFLESTRVNSRDPFAKALEQSIRWMSNSIRDEIQKTNNLQEWSMEWYRADSVLRAIDFQFLDSNVDFVPAVRELLAALDEDRPERFSKVKLNISKVVSAWLKRHTSPPKK